jgi:peptidoglycan/xylan/chitin deacetylase (PgdA/CDA1 family)
MQKAHIAVVVAVILAATTMTPAAAAAGRLTVSLAHAPSHFLPEMSAAHLTVTVAGDVPAGGPVTVTTAVPAGLTATDAGGAGWSCAVAATVTCTRPDRPKRIPPVRILVNAAADIPAAVTARATATAGSQSAAAIDTVPARDACAYGWPAGRSVSFAPPFGGIDSGVPNPSQADGCTLLDRIWAAEPFSSHRQFRTTVALTTDEFIQSGLLTRRQQRAIVVAAARSEVGTSRDHQVDNSCANRVALKFDDGTSSFRPRTLRLLRDKQVHVTFFDNGVRVAANPRIARFQGREGHIQLNHTYLHPHLDQLPADAIRDEVLRTRDALTAAGAPETFAGIRPPFGDTNAVVRQVLFELGYTEFISEWQAETPDWEPQRTAAEISEEIIGQLRPGVIIGLHDGPIDTTAGAATVEAVGMIIDRARELGFCFGVPDETGHVVADRYVASNRPVPEVTNPVPYLMPLAFGVPADIPPPSVRIPSPVRLTATHVPATFGRGSVDNTLTLTVTNASGRPTDGAAVTVVDAMPPGLTATAASGSGWTCVGVTCTRTDVLAPHAAYPPITITVAVATEAPATIVNTAAFTGHGGSWTSDASDTIPVR